MDVMQRRRSLLMQNTAPVEHWDYIMLPKYEIGADGRGKPSSIRVPVTAGNTLTIQYEGITDRSSGRFFYDGYAARNVTYNGETRNIFYCNQLTSNDGTIVIRTGRTGYVSMLIGRNETEGTTSQVFIKSVKIRVE